MKFRLNGTIWVMICTLAMGCAKGWENPSETPARHKFATLKEGSDDRLSALMDSLQRLEEQRPFMDSVGTTLGYPLWEYAVMENQKGALVVLAPLVKEGTKNVTGLIALKNKGKVSFRLYDARKPEKYGFNSRSKAANARSVFIAADLFNQRAFDHDPAVIDDPCMMSRTEMDFLTTARSASASVKPTLTAREIVGYVETCYYTTFCMGDGSGGCVGEVTVSRDCILTAVWVDDGTSNDGTYPIPDSYQTPGGIDNSGSTSTSYQNQSPNDCFSNDENLAAIAILPPSKPITNITKYLSCFSLNKGAIISIFSDQPAAGSVDAYSMKEKVGHAYLTIEQFENGRIVRRTVGFHPSDVVSPFLTKGTDSQLGDDSNEPYDVRLDISVDASTLNKVLDFIENRNPTYHLENYNCTNFVLDIADACGVQINRTKGSWFVGSGLNPGNFGEDMKKINGAIAEPGKSKENTGNCN